MLNVGMLNVYKLNVIILSVYMLNIIMMSVYMLNIIMMSVYMLNVIMLSAVINVRIKMGEVNSQRHLHCNNNKQVCKLYRASEVILFYIYESIAPLYLIKTLTFRFKRFQKTYPNDPMFVGSYPSVV